MSLNWTQLSHELHVAPLTDSVSLAIVYKAGLFNAHLMRRSDGWISPMHVKGGACLELAQIAAQRLADRLTPLPFAAAA